MRILVYKILLAALFVGVLGGLSLAQTATLYGVITHRNTPVKSGAGVPDAQLGKAGVGDLVRMFGIKGQFAEIRFPGGVAAYVLEKRGEQQFIAVGENGRGRVLVGRLSLRPHPNMDWPIMGSLRSNQTVMVLDRVDNDWLRVLAPASTHVFVHKNYVKPAPDQTAAASQFAILDQKARLALLKTGNMSSKHVLQIEQEDTLQSRFDLAEARMARELAGRPNLETLVSLRTEFEAIGGQAPANSPLSQAAGEKIAYLKGKEDTARRFAAADAQMKKLELDQKRRDAEYARDLQNFRTKKEAEKASAASSKSRFLRLGIGNLHRVYLGVGTTPTWKLTKGSESRYHVTSDRYDLSEFHDKKIGITKWEMQSPAPGSKLERVKILRLEILE